MKLYKLLPLLFFVFLSQLSLAQSSGFLTGKLQDEKGEALSFANVALFQLSDSSLLTGAVSDADGNFKIKRPKSAGTYFLQISAIGFQQKNTASFTINSKGQSKNFGSIALKEDVQLLQEVSVESLRPTVLHEADKMVVSVEGSALAVNSTAMEVLAKSPGIWVDQDGNIQLNGQAGVRILIDGRPTYLSAKELQNLLEGMSAENIKNIEIITNPSAKYEAEGTAGIINLNLKKNTISTISGLNGSINAGYQYNGLHGYSTGANLNYKKGKWSSFANLDVARRARFRDATFTREFNTAESSTKFDQSAWEEVPRFTPSLRLGTDFDLTEKHSIGASANLSYHESSHDFRTDTYIRNGNAANDLYIDADNYTENKFTNNTFNLHYAGKLDTLGSALSADLDFVKLVEKASARFTNRYDSLAPNTSDFKNLLTNENPTQFDIYSLKLDYTKVFPQNRKLELGAKASYVVSDNKLRFYTHSDESRVFDPTKSSHFIYSENIYAAYANFSTPIGEKLSLQAGLRAEKTVAEGESVTLNQTTPREYLDFFPSVFVKQNVSEDYQINYNYSRRIQRPHYGSLNPFLFYLDPFTLIQGNPYLRPQYTHSFGLTQMFKKNYSLTLEYAKTQDFIGEVPVLNDETKQTVFKVSNVEDAENLSATMVAPVKIIKNWDINNNATLAYQRYSTMLLNELQQNEQLFYMVQSAHNILLPKGIRMEVNAAYQGPLAWGMYKIEGQWWVDLGLKKSFMDDKLDLSMNVTDIFRSRQVVGSANLGDDINAFNQYFSAQSVGMSIRYRFSRGEKFEMKQRNNSLEELNRAGGN